MLPTQFRSPRSVTERGIFGESRAVRVGSDSGFTLIEIIIVLGILGGLMALLIGGLGSGSDSAKRKETEVRVNAITSKLLQFQGDMGKYPTTAEGLGALITNPGSAKWSGPYLSEDETKDGWSNPLEYELTPKGPKLTSPGADGQVGTEDDKVFIGGKIVDAQPAGAGSGEAK